MCGKAETGKLVLICVSLLSAATSASADCEEETTAPIYQDLVLREHFGGECDKLLFGYSPDTAALRSHSEVTDRGVLTVSDRRRTTIEERQWKKCIDDSIRGFLERVNRQLATLSSHYQAFSATNQRLLTTDSRDEQAQSLVRWKYLLKEIERAANKLHQTLAHVFVDLDRRQASPVSIEAGSEQTRYEKEIQLMEEVIAAAREQIDDYLLRTQHSVKPEDLRINMLDYLRRVEILAKTLRKSSN
jgi:hypothetical protein